MKQLVLIILLLWGNFQLVLSQGSSVLPLMMYGDTSRVGVPYSKDPHVVKFKGRYLMYHSIPPMKGDPASGWNIGIAESKDLVNWTKVGEITPAPGADYEKKGLCAPGALVKDGKVHLFYQTYGNGEKDAICHAVSDDGIRFKRNPTNPIFHPAGDSITNPVFHSVNCGTDLGPYRTKLVLTGGKARLVSDSFPPGRAACHARSLS